LAVAGGLFAGGDRVVIGETSASRPAAPKVIELHAPNNATPSVTIWVSQARTQSPANKPTSRHPSAKVVELHAPDSPISSVTVMKAD
jgi:hypothetical protein